MGVGVLSNRDIRERIRSHHLVEDPIEDAANSRNVQPSCYDLSIGHIVTSFSIIGPTSPVSAYVLKSGEVVTIFSRQKVNLPGDITGLLIPKNGPATKGLLMLNLGHVDPGWEGNVTVQVVNLNRSPYLLNLGDPVFSIVFNTLSTAAEGPTERKSSIDARLAEVHGSMLSRQSLLTVEDLSREFIARDGFGIELLKHLGPVVGVAIAAAALALGYFQFQLALTSSAQAVRGVQPTQTIASLQATPAPQVSPAP